MTSSDSGASLADSVADFDATALLAAAATGDQRSWNAIVERYSGLVWAVARGFRLGTADAADVAQATWLHLVEHMGQIRDANRLGAWLATTARREALGVLRRAGHDVPAGDMGLLDTVEEPADSPENRLLRTERDTQLWRAFRRLGGDCQRLLRILLAEPKPTYLEVGAALNMPVGSIGPTRGRCLAELRHLLVD